MSKNVGNIKIKFKRTIIFLLFYIENKRKITESLLSLKLRHNTNLIKKKKEKNSVTIN